jgi:hypothetical protein
MKFFCRCIPIFCLLYCYSVPQIALAQDTIPAQEEIWPEVDLFLKVNDRHRLYLLVSGTRQRNSYYTDGSFGIHYDYFFMRENYFVKEGMDSTRKYNMWIRGGYMYAASPPSQEDVFREHTIVTEANHRLYLPDHWLLTNKNRVDWRMRDDKLTVRYRPRLNIERDFSTGYATFTGYFYTEYFINFGKSNLNRLRLCVGSEFWLFRFLSFEIYYLHQFPNKPDVGQTDAIGLAFKFYFHTTWRKKPKP